MPMSTSGELVKRAQSGRYAVPAFNAENMEMIQAITAAAERAGSPVIIQTTPSTVKYIGLDMARAMVEAAARPVSVPVALHLDHAESFELTMRAVRAGYTSLMIDGSRKGFGENVDVTTAVVRVAAAMGLDVEAELGMLGGKEDGPESGGDVSTDPAEAEDFVRRTGVHMLAVAIGTAHGFYKGEPKLDFDRLRAIRRRISIPLVLHGASGLPDDMVRTAIGLGMCKINFATELRFAATKAVRDVLADPGAFDPKKYLGPAREAVTELCLHKIDVCGSRGKA